MKIQYHAPDDQNRYPKYFLRAESRAEMKFFTILRDLMKGKANVSLKFVGADLVGKQVPGLPQDPVQNIGLYVEDPDFVRQGSPEALTKKLMDPNKDINLAPEPKPQRRVARGSGRDTIILDM